MSDSTWTRRMRADVGEIDFEAEGLLEGLDGEAREARGRLLAELADDGVALEELRTAAAEDRLALLPVERVLSGGGPSADPRRGGRARRGRPGVPRSASGGRSGWRWRTTRPRVYTERDVEAAKRVRALLEAGLPEEGMLEVARLLGMSMSQLAAANRRLIAQTFMREGDTEYDVAKRFAAAARGVHAAGRRDASLRARPPPARADPPRRVRGRRALRRTRGRGRARRPSASPTWSTSPASARRSSRRSSGR